MLEEELAGHVVVLERRIGLLDTYDVRRTDSSGASVGEPIAEVTWGTHIRDYAGYHVLEGDRWVLEVVRKQLSLAIRPLYVVTDGADGALGTFQHETLTAKRWQISDADGTQLATLERRSPPLGLLRAVLNRFFLAAVPLPYRFVFLSDGVEVGSFRRLAKPRHRYALDLTADPDGKLDPRLALAVGIELATIEQVD